MLKPAMAPLNPIANLPLVNCHKLGAQRRILQITDADLIIVSSILDIDKTRTYQGEVIE